MALPELKFLNLPQIDKDIQTERALEFKNALAPFVRRQTEMDLEKGGLELQVYRDKIERERRIRDQLQTLATGGAQPAVSAPVERPSSFAPGGEGSPKVGGPDWMQSYQADQPQKSQPAVKQSGSAKQELADRFIKQAEIYSQNGDADSANKLYEHAAKFMPKVKDWQKVDVGGGQVMYAPYFEDGTAGAPVPYKVAEKLHFANIGPETVGQNQFTGEIVSRVKNGRSPDSLASEATQRYVHDTPSGSALLSAQQGKIPPGYRVSADGSRLEAIPGGPADIGKALPSPAVKDLTGAGTAYENSQRLKNTFKDDFGGKVVLGDMSNTMGRIFGDSSGQAQWWQDMDQQQNLTRHDLFGSALTKTELAAWEKTSVTPNMAPEQIRQNLERRAEIEARAASKMARAYQAAGYNKEQIRELMGNAAQYLNNPAPPVGQSGGAPRSGAATSWKDAGYKSGAEAQADAIQAIRNGAPKEEVKRRLEAMGLGTAFLGK